MNRTEAIRALSDSQLAVGGRLEACNALRDLRADEPEFEEAIAALLSAGRDESPIGDAARAVLRTVTENRYDTALRAVRSKAEADLAEVSAVDPARLQEILLSEDETPERKHAACFVLGETNPPGAITSLLAIFSQGDVDLAYAAANALLHIRSKLGRPLGEVAEHLVTAARETADPELKKAAVYALTLGHHGGEEFLIELFEDPNSSTELRTEIVRGLPHQHILRALRDPDVSVRAAAAGLLNTLIPEGRDALKRLLNDETAIPGEDQTISELAKWKLGKT